VVLKVFNQGTKDTRIPPRTPPKNKEFKNNIIIKMVLIMVKYIIF